MDAWVRFRRWCLSNAMANHSLFLSGSSRGFIYNQSILTMTTKSQNVAVISRGVIYPVSSALVYFPQNIPWLKVGIYEIEIDKRCYFQYYTNCSNLSKTGTRKMLIQIVRLIWLDLRFWFLYCMSAQVKMNEQNLLLRSQSSQMTQVVWNTHPF